MEKKVDSSFYLIFSINDSRYSIPADKVVEILWFPELTFISSLPEFLIGVFNFRGEIIPVLDINLRQDFQTHQCSVNDKIIVIQMNDKKLALRITMAHEVINIENFDMIPYEKNHQNQTSVPIISRIIKYNNEIIQKVDIENLVPLEIVLESVEDNKLSSDKTTPLLNKLFSEFSKDELSVLKKRKESYLKEADKVQEGLTSLISIAIVMIEGENFGIDLRDIVEFSEIHSLTNVPCTPEHIAGCMNLRGDILTLLDMNYLLKSKTNTKAAMGKVVVVKKDELIVGLVVDELLDVIYVDKKQFLISPLMVTESESELIKETYFYQNQTIGILDIDRLCGREDLIVNVSLQD
ncbi:MAG: chemotaxis protein CheW [Leptospiraceae bacterium]|nr:chemotaxis protein CheW [Leptospiraceae bacterium]MCP5492972.1 chemotaxis protein CheW [Leptospiraceae bacterium]